VIPLPVFLVNDENSTQIVNTGVMKTRPSQENKTNIFPRNNSERSSAASFSLMQCLKQKCFPDAFLFGFVIVMSYLPGHLSQHAKAATAEGLTFSDPIHKKSARNLNLYDFFHYCLTDLSVDSNDITALVLGEQKHYFHLWGLQKPLVAFATRDFFRPHS
jgi:hypothetical protein